MSRGTGDVRDQRRWLSQEWLDNFRTEYKELRPYEALGMRTPGQGLPIQTAKSSAMTSCKSIIGTSSTVISPSL